MKRTLSVFIVMAIIFTGCGPKPRFSTVKGKRKNKHYNSIQYDRNSWNKKSGKGTF